MASAAPSEDVSIEDVSSAPSASSTSSAPPSVVLLKTPARKRNQEGKPVAKMETFFSPVRQRSKKAGTKTNTFLTTESDTPKKTELVKKTIVQNLQPGSKPRFGTGGLNLIDVYEQYGKDSFTRSSSPFEGLPGIYVITPCANADQTPCVPDKKITIKVGTAKDLAYRLDDYHTYFPYGFTILRLYVLERAERAGDTRTHAPFTSAQIDESEIENMLENAETHIFRYMHYTLPFKKMVITRPARSEWFRADSASKTLEYNLKRLDAFVTTLKLLPPSMPLSATSPVYGTFFKQCCTSPRFSIELRALSPAEETRRFTDLPDPYKTATFVRKAQFGSIVSSGRRQTRQTVAIINGNVVDSEGHVIHVKADGSIAPASAPVVAPAGAAAAAAAASEEEEEEPEPGSSVRKRIKFAGIEGGFIHNFFGLAPVLH